MTEVKNLTVKQQAEAEVAAEKVQKAKKVLKELLRKLDSAKQVVSNIEREIEDAERQIDQGLTVQSAN